MRRPFLLSCAVTILGLANLGADFNWPQSRVSEQQGLPETWSATDNVAWKTPIAGRGWSSPIVAGGRIFLTSVISEGKTSPPKKGLYMGGNRLTPPKELHRWMVYCVDFNSGKILWEKLAYQGVPSQPIHIKNSYASETPVSDGERLYVYFGNVGVFCYSLDGSLLWEHKLRPFKMLMGWGTAASPILHKDRLYIVDDNEEQSFLGALDARTGKEIWRVSRDEKSNWATPFVWENRLRTEIITAGRNKVRSYDPSGKLLWELKGMSSIVIPTPFARDELLYVSSGYVMDSNRPVYVIRPGAHGDISLKKDQTSNEFIAWYHKTAGSYNPTPLLYGECLYVLKDGGVLTCYEARTGKSVYSGKRLGGATAFTSSPWAHDGKIFCLSEDGDTFVVQAGPEFKILHKNSLGEMCLATPAIANGSLIVRTENTLYRIQKGAQATTTLAR
jgi:outer membrane protein assembly factor BamB